MPKTPKVQYSKENLQKAIEAAQDADNKLSTRQIAEKYGVPRSSLRYYIKNPGHKTSLGPSPVLTVSEESHLEHWIITSARKGFPRNKEDVLDSVQKFLVENPRPNSFSNNRPGDGWWKAFLKRHPRLTIRTSEGVTKASSCVSEKDIRGWFTEILNYAAEKDLTPILSEPHRIFNADETNFQICVKTGQVIAEKGAKNVYNVEQSQAKESITVLLTFSAAGDVCCPFVIYPYQRLPEKISDSLPDGWGIGKSDTGWMTTEVFYEYIANVFHPYLLSQNIKLPVILYVDGHKTHLNFHLSQLCTYLQIELIALYPNATRILQPADVAAFRPLKLGWKKTLRKWQNEHNNQGVTKLNFATVLNDAVIMSLRPEILVNGFKACGLYPFNPDAIDYSKCLGATNNNVAMQNKQLVPDSAMISYANFRKIIGPSIITDFENRRQKLSHQKMTEHLDILYKVWEAYHDAEIVGNSNQDVDCSVLIPHENGERLVVIDSRVVTPQKKDQELIEENKKIQAQETSEGIEGASSLDLTSFVPETMVSKPTTTTALKTNGTRVTSFIEPFTSSEVIMAHSTLQVPSPKIVKRKWSLGEYLAYPITPIRKGKRQTERQPYAISSHNFKAALHTKQKEKENLLKVKEEKKLIRDKTKTENSDKKTAKIKNKSNTIPVNGNSMLKTNGETIKINKHSNRIPENEDFMINANGETVNIKETDTIKGNYDQTEHFRQQLEPMPKRLKKEVNIKTKEKKEIEQLPASKKITVLSDVIIKPVNNSLCGVCHTNVKKSQLTCSACSKIFHARCIPRNHKEHIPDNTDLNLFLCHHCFTVDDSESGDSDSSSSSTKELLDAVMKAKRNPF